MFQISDHIIAQSATQKEIEKGRECFSDKRVKFIHYDRENNIFSVTVAGTMDYFAKVYFDAEGRIKHATCTCPYIGEYDGYCRHVVAALLSIMQMDRQSYFKDLKQHQTAKHLLSLFQGSVSAPTVPVKLEVVYEHDKTKWHGKGLCSAISISIGEDRLYSVRNLKAFLDSLHNGEEIIFGKGFNFNPAIHFFRPEDKPIIDFLLEIYEMEMLKDGFSYGTRGSIFRNKQVFLTSIGTKRIFSLIKDRTFKAIIRGETYNTVRILDKDFPVNFHLLKDGDELALRLSFDEPLLPLTDDGEYFFAGGSIYKITRKQQENFKPFFMAMAYQKSKIIYFQVDEKERMISEVLPFAKKAGTVTVDEEVDSLIEKPDMEAEVYLDGNSENIDAELKFIYGKRCINPFAGEKANLDKERKILIRDMEKEQAILAILESTEFEVVNNLIHLDGEERVFDFVHDIIPKLQQYCSIFYSESFKRIPIRTITSFTGGIRLNERTGMLEFSFSMEGIERPEMPDIFEVLRQKKKYYRLKDGTFLNLNSKELQEAARISEYLGMKKDDFEKDYVEIPKYRALYMDQYLKKAGWRYFEKNHAFRELIRNINEPEDVDLMVPEELRGVLREYQRFGFKWLKTMALYGMGAILADDMGLGKTLQVITLILSSKKEKGSFPSLVVVPTSLVYNWEAEILKFAPELKTAVISGNRKEREEKIDSGIVEADVMITSYSLLRKDIDKYKELSFRYCILDEAQYIKNPTSQNAKAAKEIKAQNSIALTGTPMENNLEELWSIFDFIMPGYLFSHEKFQEKYMGPIAREEDARAMQDLSMHIRPFILRRLKTDVLNELPDKIEHEMTAELTVEQKRIYLAYLEKVKAEIDDEIGNHGYERSHIKILAALTRLRQICCHPALLLDGYEGESGKMQLLQELVNNSISGGHRILLFSQFTSMLHIIRNWMDSEGIDYLYLDGATKLEERWKLVRDFNAGKGDVFLISLKAGGTGLNLTGADTVIHYDPWWNPAVEDQATDRAYRIGQSKAVHVIKLMAKGTIEEKIFSIQQKKRKLIDAVIQPGETLLSKMSEDEIRALFE